MNDTIPPSERPATFRSCRLTKSSRLLRVFCELLIPAAAVMMFLGAVTRYAFTFSPPWLTELTGFFHAIAFLGLAGYALQDDKHVRIDILAARFGEKGRRIADTAGFFLLLLPYCICIAWFSTGFIVSSWEIYEGSREFQGMPGVFLLKTMIWVYAATLVVTGFRTLVLRKISVHTEASCS